MHMKPTHPEAWDEVGWDITNPKKPHNFVTSADLFARTFIVEVKLVKHGKPVCTWSTDCQLPKMPLEQVQELGAHVFTQIYKNQNKWELE